MTFYGPYFSVSFFFSFFPLCAPRTPVLVCVCVALKIQRYSQSLEESNLWSIHYGKHVQGVRSHSSSTKIARKASVFFIKNRPAGCVKAICRQKYHHQHHYIVTHSFSLQGRQLSPHRFLEETQKSLILFNGIRRMREGASLPRAKIAFVFPNSPSQKKEHLK